VAGEGGAAAAKAGEDHVSGRGFHGRQINTGLADIDSVFSPDGEKMAFERPNPFGSPRDICRMRVDGTRKYNLAESPDTDANPSWQPMP
jgi:Tol biopolymer transport system component